MSGTLQVQYNAHIQTMCSVKNKALQQVWWLQFIAFMQNRTFSKQTMCQLCWTSAGFAQAACVTVWIQTGLLSSRSQTKLSLIHFHNAAAWPWKVCSGGHQAAPVPQFQNIWLMVLEIMPNSRTEGHSWSLVNIFSWSSTNRLSFYFKTWQTLFSADVWPFSQLWRKHDLNFTEIFDFDVEQTTKIIKQTWPRTGVKVKLAQFSSPALNMRCSSWQRLCAPRAVPKTARAGSRRKVKQEVETFTQL